MGSLLAAVTVTASTAAIPRPGPEEPLLSGLTRMAAGVQPQLIQGIRRRDGAMVWQEHGHDRDAALQAGRLILSSICYLQAVRT